MKLIIGILCLNEMQWLPFLWKQHKDWPEVAKLVFVEAADRVYAECNPERVSPDGLSVDGTTDFLAALSREDSRVVHVRHGITSHPDPAQGKCAARQRYLDVAEEVKPTHVVICDADEFYTHKAQRGIIEAFRRHPMASAFVFRQRHIWRPPSLADQPLFAQEVVGGYWAVPHVRGWKWEPGLRYRQNHNWPEDRRGRLLIHKGQARLDRQEGSPCCVHLGYASSAASRISKHAYYVARGEGSEGGRIGRTRSMYVACREAWANYQPGNVLPSGVTVLPYTGDIPEVFLETPCLSSSS